MQGLNSVILMGRIGSDPDLRQTQQGKALCRFRLAIPRLKREGEGWVEEAEWQEIVLWDQQAERFHRRAGRGDLCTVEGRLASHSWTDGEGKRHWKVEVVAQRANVVNTGRRPTTDTPSLPDPVQESRSTVAMPDEMEDVEEAQPAF